MNENEKVGYFAGDLISKSVGKVGALCANAFNLLYRIFYISHSILDHSDALQNSPTDHFKTFSTDIGSVLDEISLALTNSSKMISKKPNLIQHNPKPFLWHTEVSQERDKLHTHIERSNRLLQVDEQLNKLLCELSSKQESIGEMQMNILILEKSLNDAKNKVSFFLIQMENTENVAQNLETALAKVKKLELSHEIDLHEISKLQLEHQNIFACQESNSRTPKKNTIAKNGYETSSITSIAGKENEQLVDVQLLVYSIL